MEHVVRVVHRIARKFLKKRRNSIEGRWPNDSIQKRETSRPSMDDTTEIEKEVVPLTPAHARSLDILRVSTPAKTPGILVLEEFGQESEMEEKEKEDAVSQADDCIDYEEWNESAHDIHIDTSEEFVLSGGDESSSVFCDEEEMDIGEKRNENEYKDHTISNDFIIEDEYEEDDFYAMAVLQSSFPIEKKHTEGYLFHPTTLVADDEGYEWEEPLGYSNPALAPSLPHNLIFPALCQLNDEVLQSMARSIIEEDATAINKRNERSGVDNVKWDEYYTIDFSIPIECESSSIVFSECSRSNRPDTPTTNGDATTSPSIDSSNEIVHSSSSASASIPISSSFKPKRPQFARDEDNEWLRSLYQKNGLTHEIPQWMRVDLPKKIVPHMVSPMMGESKVDENKWRTSTPVLSGASPAFSSISTIANDANDSSRTINSPSCNDSISIGGKTYTLEVGVRCRAAFSRPMNEFLHIIPIIDDLE
ncbi:hypothetical protein PENTCL1PPCAC_11387 [Pristionchus entomophagus]|uniref:Uncharacterized protein n=1 Tax=Pristionchus entomophagus TaxID=358040 RepID=A0AAV5T2K3_9BILA|nr:hypothetical protein PENTCL1PPCAC_11387 [Pristionchus entomophagus]